MRYTAPFLGLVAFALSACAQVDAGLDTAIDLETQASENLGKLGELRMKHWLNASCRQDLEAVRKADMSPEFRKALLDRCLGEAAPNE